MHAARPVRRKNEPSGTRALLLAGGPKPPRTRKLIAELRELNSEVLAVAAGLSRGTIETVLAKSDLQLGAEALPGGRAHSGTGRPGPQRWRRRRQARSSSPAARPE
jgi:hypothetical protein